MRKQFIAIFTAILLTASVAGCSSMTTGQKQAVGAVGGGVLGGVAGSALTGHSTAGAIAGTLGGAYLGSQVPQYIK
jgi:osmotically inducible lipoprotein OsmB